MPNKPGTVDTSFSPHCPACGGTLWNFTTSDDSRACANSACGELHWFRNAPVEASSVATGRITYTETVEDYLATEKRKRVRALVFAMIASDKSIGTNTMDVVRFCNNIDNDIEALK